jgi:hypothetical protein
MLPLRRARRSISSWPTSRKNVLLSEYRIRTRRLLNDAQGRYWTSPELDAYINEARDKTAVDTACVRKFQLGNVQKGVEKYLYSTLLPEGDRTVDVIGAQFIFGNTRYSLRWYDYTYFTAFYRPWTQYRQLPIAFTIYGPNIIWFAPVPNVDYPNSEFDTAVVPEALVNDNTVDTIPVPYTDAVKYYAARLAKIRMQQYEEALAFDKLYTQRINELNVMYPRRIHNIYESDFD